MRLSGGNNDGKPQEIAGEFRGSRIKNASQPSQEFTSARVSLFPVRRSSPPPMDNVRLQKTRFHANPAPGTEPHFATDRG